MVKMAFLKERLNKMDMEKVGYYWFWAMYQCILNEPLWNDWNKLTYSKVHGSPVLKALPYQSFLCVSATSFAELIHIWGRSKMYEFQNFLTKKNLVLRW